MLEWISNYVNPTPLLSPTQKTPEAGLIFIIQPETDLRRKKRRMEGYCIISG